mmetsp:Transcript_12886/g.28460  ORF Transcript_12886/g.28460 Transcript_12886/m.28460 type:complete len:115 (+) Transcript_12886:1333-1677(+)
MRHCLGVPLTPARRSASQKDERAEVVRVQVSVSGTELLQSLAASALGNLWLGRLPSVSTVQRELASSMQSALQREEGAEFDRVREGLGGTLAMASKASLTMAGGALRSRMQLSG